MKFWDLSGYSEESHISSDQTGHTGESAQTPGNFFLPRKSLRINQRNRSDLEISRTNWALTSSNSRIKPKKKKNVTLIHS